MCCEMLSITRRNACTASGSARLPRRGRQAAGAALVLRSGPDGCRTDRCSQRRLGPNAPSPGQLILGRGSPTSKTGRRRPLPRHAAMVAVRSGQGREWWCPSVDVPVPRPPPGLGCIRGRREVLRRKQLRQDRVDGSPTFACPRAQPTNGVTDPKRSPGSRRSRQNGVEASQVRLQQARWGSTESADEHRRREAGADATQADPSRPGAGTTVTLNCSMRDQAKPQRSYTASFLTVARRPNGRLTACHPDTPSETRKVRRTSAHPLRISASLQYKFTYALPQGRAGRMAIEVPTGGAIRRTRGGEASGLASRPAFAVRFAADERGPANSYLAGPHPFCPPSLDSR
jgi:hypothetical protein